MSLIPSFLHCSKPEKQLPEIKITIILGNPSLPGVNTDILILENF